MEYKVDVAERVMVYMYVYVPALIIVNFSNYKAEIYHVNFTSIYTSKNGELPFIAKLIINLIEHFLKASGYHYKATTMHCSFYLIFMKIDFQKRNKRFESKEMNINLKVTIIMGIDRQAE